MARETPPNPGAATTTAPRGGSSADRAIFCKEGEYWTIGYAGKIFRLKDTKGLACIAHLLAHPAKEFHALELAQDAAARSEPGESDVANLRSNVHELQQAGIHARRLGDAGQLLDDQAKAAYRRRITELREEQAEARTLGRVERAEEVEREMDALVAELSRATGLGGRDRFAASSSERARQSVSRRINNALSRIADHHLPLGQMLARCIRTGTYCSYNPEPNLTVAWEFEPSQGSSATTESPADISDQQSSVASGAFAVQWPSSFGRTEFVGRQGETELLRSLIDRALDGVGAVAMIGGGPGVGKTRLAMEISCYAAEKGFRCFTGRCHEDSEPYPYLPFVEVLELMLARSASPENFRRELGDNGAELAQVAPRLRHVFPDLPAPAQLPVEMRRHYVRQTFAEFFFRASQQSPIFLVLDDLHWADEATLGLLDFIANRIEHTPLVLLGTYRDAELDSNPALIRTLDELIHDGLRPLKLQGLSHAGVAQMIRSLSLGEPPLQFVRLTFEETQGNPFFVEEIYKHLVEEGKIFDAAGGFRSGLTLDENDVPENVRLVLRRRLGRLSEEARQVLTAAAVIGRSFNFELLQAAIEPIDIGNLLAAVEHAQRMGLIVNSDATESELNFAHELVRQTLLTDISRPRRQRLHLAVAEAIERLDAERLDERAAVLAHHLQRAGRLADPAKTAGYFWQAGKRALEGGAYEEAYRSFETAASYQETELRWRAQCLLGMENANRGLGHWEDALRRSNEAAEIYRQLGDIGMATDRIAAGAGGLLVTGKYQEAAEMAQRGLAELGDDATEGRADLLAALGLSYGCVGAYVPAKNALSEATAVAQKLCDPKLTARHLAYLSLLNYFFLEVADSLVNSQRCLDLPPSVEQEFRVTALFVQMTALQRLGRSREASRITTELDPLARTLGDLNYVAACIWTKAWTEFGRAPDLARLEAQLGEGLEIGRGGRIPPIIALSLHQVSLAKFFRAERETALDYALEACRQELPGDFVEGFAIGTLFREQAYLGDRARAIALLNEKRSKLPRANQPNTMGSWAFLVSVVEGLAMLGERDQAAELYPLVQGLLDTGMICFPWIARFSQTIAGVAASAARKWQAAEEHFRIALKQAEEIPDQLERADCRRFYGSMLLDRNEAGDVEKAQRLLTDALGDYSRIGMPFHVELTKTLLRNI